MAPSITCLPALPADLLSISRLEALVFYDENFDIIAFGPNRASEEKLLWRAKGLSKPPRKVGEESRIIKAVMKGGGGEEVIVGAAIWTMYRGRGSWGEEEREGRKGEKDEGWGEGSNVRFCADAFLAGDKAMEDSVGGCDMLVSPSLPFHFSVPT